MQSKNAVIAVNRFGLGARPTDSAAIGRDAVGWLESQLDGAARDSMAPAVRPESAVTLERITELRLARQLANQRAAEIGGAGRRRAAAQSSQSGSGDNRDDSNGGDPAPAADRDAIREYARFIGTQYRQQVGLRNQRAIETDAPFRERLVHFWSNHFAVSTDKQPIAAIAVAYENEAIRPHVTGSFRDMLGAVEQHPAMLLYLDNQASVGPQSQAARAVQRNRGRSIGLNENLAREILELHTLGVDGGYSQQDVTEFAKVLTGWSIGGQRGGLGRLGGGKPGEFTFRALVHEPGDKTVLGRRYREQGLDEGQAVLDTLAAHPATAHHLATKLARHFLADVPPPGLVERLAQVYLEASGELTPVYRALIHASESWQEPFAKYKTPQDFVISTYRALNRRPDNIEALMAFLTQLGQRPLNPGSPAGWPDTAADWDGGDALLKRIEWSSAVGRSVADRIDAVELGNALLAPALSTSTRNSIERAESGAQAIALLFAAPEFQRR